MDHPTPEREREFYMEALKAAAPLVAAMDGEEQVRLIQHWRPDVTDQDTALYFDEGTLRVHAATAAADMLWEHIMRFKSTSDMTLEEHLDEQP